MFTRSLLVLGFLFSTTSFADALCMQSFRDKIAGRAFSIDFADEQPLLKTTHIYVSFVQADTPKISFDNETKSIYLSETSQPGKFVGHYQGARFRMDVDTSTNPPKWRFDILAGIEFDDPIKIEEDKGGI